MNWKEFKERVESQGVKDEDEIWYIDISFDDDFECHNSDERLGWAIG